MTAYIRPLTSLDLDRCAALESAAFPPSEAATYEKSLNLATEPAINVSFIKIDYRLSSCPELCYGLFLRNPDAAAPDPSIVRVLSSADAQDKDGILVAHTIATKARATLIVDQDMDYPKDWKTNPRAVADAGHQPSGTSVALHSLAVSPDYQRQGLGKLLMGKYIEQVKKLDGVERISILTYERLVPYYEKLGFKNHGKSAATYAGVSWYDLVRFAHALFWEGHADMH
ncbi:Polyamine N-acetyltransferase 1 [Metarhizium anisopliae]